jgi:hypothetical protein
MPDTSDAAQDPEDQGATARDVAMAESFGGHEGGILSAEDIEDLDLVGQAAVAVWDEPEGTDIGEPRHIVARPELDDFLERSGGVLDEAGAVGYYSSDAHRPQQPHRLRTYHEILYLVISEWRRARILEELGRPTERPNLEDPPRQSLD